MKTMSDNTERGKIRNRDAGKQIIDYSGLRYNNITPTDIDGLIEYKGKAFIFYEFKFNNAPMPLGQRIALTRLVDAIQKGGTPAMLILCSHNNPASEDIDAAHATAKAIYWQGAWGDGCGRTVREVTDGFLKYIG
jgi:hypothetical protein